MRRNRARFSRALIVVLVIALVLGAIFTIHNLTRGKAVAEASTIKPAPPVVNAAGATPAVAGADQTPVKAAVESPGTSQTNVANQAEAPATPPVAATGNASPAPAARPAMSAESVSAALHDGKTQLDAGNLLEARRLLNDALQSGKLSDADDAQAKAMLAQISKVVFFSPRVFPDDQYAGTFKVPPGGVLAKIGASHNVTWELLAKINNVSPRSLRAGQTIKVINGPFHAVVNKKEFTLDVYLKALPGQPGSLYVTTLGVGLGKDDSTPTGLWEVQQGGKLKNPKFWGVADLKPVEAGDPNNPLGHYWIALTGLHGNAVGQQSYGIHGTNEPNTIGTQASHGCIRLRDADIELVYALLVDGKSTVLVKD